MYCHNCGSEIKDNDFFCSKCGTKRRNETKDEDVQPSHDINKVDDDECNSAHTIMMNLQLCISIIVVLGLIGAALFMGPSDTKSFGTLAAIEGRSEPEHQWTSSESSTPQNIETPDLTQEDNNLQICEKIVQDYYKTHTYVTDDVFDCDNMAMDVWNLVESQGINAEIAVGNVNIKDASIKDINHAWVVAEISPQTWVAIECTGGYTTHDDNYYSGYFFDNPKNYQRFLTLYTTWEFQCQDYENYRIYYNELVEQYNKANAIEQYSLSSGLTVARQNLDQKERDFLNTDTELNALLEYG